MNRPPIHELFNHGRPISPEDVRALFTDENISHLNHMYHSMYEELSGDPFTDSEGGMSIAEKSARSSIVFRKVLWHLLTTGERKHYKDIPPEA